MLVSDARAVAREWVVAEAAHAPGFLGAFFHGSINWLPDDAVMPAASDVDIMVVRVGTEPQDKLGKLMYRGVLLEVSYLPEDALQTPEQILSTSHLAGSFRKPGIILDPSGRLTSLQAAVARDYARRHWVYQRCLYARNKVISNLQGVKTPGPFHDQVISWLFGTGVTVHILLVAGLKNPTVRKRYLAVRELLNAYGYGPFYNTLLEMLGCAQMTRSRAEHHLAVLAGAYDAATQVIKTPFYFASDISTVARQTEIGGSRELIENGNHREAVFWMAVTYSRCQKVFSQDAPGEVREKYLPGYRDLLADLGIASFADLQQRSQQVIERLPDIWKVAEAILAANPEIED